MRELLERKFFPFVEKPPRYIGGEPGSVIKDPEDLVNIALGYPDLYEIGMSYVGGQMLYHLINRQTDALCERVYAPGIDAEEILRRENIPLFTLESHRPLKEFDLIGFTLSYEMVYTNLLNILDLAAIPLMADSRGDDVPLIVAGGPICYNPEPMADFIDFFFIGEVEEALPELIAALKEGKGRSRRQKLELLAKLESVYVPAFYDRETGLPHIEGIPSQIKTRHATKLLPEYYPDRPLMPLTEIAHDRVSVEIMRGCPQGCRFCQAGKIYKPVRVRHIDDIKKQVAANIQATGYDEISLLSLSTSDYPGIDNLITSLNGTLQSQRVSLSLPSLRPSSFTSNLADAAGKGHKSGLTFAPEVGTDRLRKAVGKKITEAEILDAAGIAFSKGWQLIKLYFMIGLPTETTEDINGITDLVMKIVKLGRQIKGQHKINVAISPFSPKAHTPFQWDKLHPPEEIRRRQDILRRGLNAREVNLKFRNPQLSYLEGVLGRGDRRLGPVILTAFKNGARFDGWSEHFDYHRWVLAFEENGLTMEEFSIERSFSERLPWDHIDRGQSRQQLQIDRSRTSEVAVEPASPAETPAAAPVHRNEDDMYGRRKKRIVAPQDTAAPTRGKIRLKWGKTGLVRFLSHLDNNRVFERAIRRAGIPVTYSQGFHPHQKLSFGPPLPVGYSSECEYLDIKLNDAVGSGQLKDLAQTMPKGFFISDSKTIYSKAPAISALLNRAVYQIRGDLGDTSRLAETLEKILASDSVIGLRTTKDGGKKVDIRPAIYRLELLNQDTEPMIEMELGLGDGGYAKPGEVLSVLELFDPDQIGSFKIHRKALQYRDKDGIYLDPLSAIV
ncbi:MAG: TIGR03960 family B12-binding radical SAM protein [FCB group bacterium]|nr:TIGR03960 family B12-binding radical SAM protein [FCB group bacterium]